MSQARLGVLLSGRGSNFLALHDAILRQELSAEIVLVVANVADAPGLAHARDRGLATLALPHQGQKRREHDRRVVAALQEARVEWVCLAGYMRVLTDLFVDAFAQRILNIHPSLLPAFPGLDPQKQALEHGVKVSGCTVHLVDQGLDSGPIVLQEPVPVEDGDTVATLSARILEKEHKAYARALRRLLTEPWRVEGRRLVFGGAFVPP